MNAAPSIWPNAYTNTLQAIHIPEGTRFGRLTVIKRAPNIGKNRGMLVKCDCGNEKVVQARYLRHGMIKSCGCLREHKIIDGVKRTEHPLYQVWKNMHNKTTKRRHSGYLACGDIGIRVCEQWQSFEQWLKDMGPRPPRTMLCRVDQMKDFTPENTRWLTAMQKRAIHGSNFTNDRTTAAAV